MKHPTPVTVDFETNAIEPRPKYPPEPVGVSIKKWGRKARYYAWGHRGGGNNATIGEARAALAEVWGGELLFHNAKFDVDVATTHMGLAEPSWNKIHDTLFLLFLDRPHQPELSLKPCSERYLGWKPEERDALAEWLIANQPLKEQRVRITKTNFGAYIAEAPVDVVGPYANGDVDRTEALFRHLWKRVTVERGMAAAYDRERRLLPVLLDIERRGVRVDADRLRADIERYKGVYTRLEAWLRKRLCAAPDVNLKSDDQLVAALQAAGVVDVSKLGVTKTGKLQTNKAALAAGVTDAQVTAVLKYLAQLQTCLATFMEPWLATADASNGLIYTQWNQTRGERRGGTRTGRLSSTPNLQNIPKEFEPIFRHEEAALPRDERKSLPRCPIVGVPPLPLCRGYIVPYKKGHVLVGRDFQQQELRILAHFEGGSLLRQYQENQWIDFHDNVKYQLETRFRRPFKRKPVKNINFGLIYGQGIGSLAEKNGESYEETKALRDAVFALYPGLKAMYTQMKALAAAGKPFATWGGREYFCEEPAIVNGRIMTFDYRMLNTRVQGSAAECTKEAMIRYWESKPPGHFLLLTVHDELVSSVPARELARAQEVMRDAMESVEFDVKILSEGAYSDENWAAMIDYDKKGQIIVRRTAA